MEIEGKIIRDLPLQEGVSRAGNPWKKKEWVLETFGQYPRQVCFHFFGDRVDSNPLRIAFGGEPAPGYGQPASGIASGHDSSNFGSSESDDLPF